MKRTTAAIFYLGSIGILCAVLYIVLGAGKALDPTEAGGVEHILSHNKIMEEAVSVFQHPVAVFILQLTLIIAMSQACGYLFRKVGQPAVMGEIVAGILLGPSLLGTLLPGFSAFVFPVSSLGNLHMLSQVGLMLFMFVIGMELDMELLKQKARAAVFISYFSIVFPFMLGITLAYFLYSRFSTPSVHFYSFSLFVGIAMSITAFPVLARIIKERGLSGTRLGTLAITAAAIGDVAAWCMLAFIVAIVKAGSVTSSVYTLIAATIYVLAMLFAVKPALKMLARQRDDHSILKRSYMAVIIVVLLVSSYCCEVIGIHALFGAFLAGAIMPDEWNFRKLLIDKIEDVALVLLLPLFFVFTGLRTQIGLLSDPSLWGPCGLIIAVAVIGKFGGSVIAARIAGESTQDSLAVGALMNTRGLVELVVLNIGYDLHIISPQLFTMMVIMALVTTFMTNPALNIINRLYGRK